MLTPSDIKAQTFSVGKRGYDVEQVTSFLSQIADQVNELEAKLDRLRESAPAANQASANDSRPEAAQPSVLFEDVSAQTRIILEHAHKAGIEIQRKARARGDQELAEAYSEAASLVGAGQRRREAIEGVVDMLEQRRTVLAGNLHAITSNVHELLDGVAPGGRLPTTDELLPATDAEVESGDHAPSTAAH